MFGDGYDLIAGTQGYLNKHNSKLKSTADGLQAMSGGLGLASMKFTPAIAPAAFAKLSEIHIRNRIEKEKNRYNTTSERLSKIPTNLKIRKTLPQDAVRSLELK